MWSTISDKLFSPKDKVQSSIGLGFNAGGLPAGIDGSLPPIKILEQYFLSLADHDSRIESLELRMEEVEPALEHFRRSKRIEHWQLQKLKAAVAKVATRWKEDYCDKVKVYPPSWYVMIWAPIKRNCGVSRVSDIPEMLYSETLEFIESIGTFEEFSRAYRK